MGWEALSVQDPDTVVRWRSHSMAAAARSYFLEFLDTVYPVAD